MSVVKISIFRADRSFLKSKPALLAESRLLSPQAMLPSVIVQSLNVVVETELVRVRAESHGIRFTFSLISNKCFDQLFTEDVALQQERVVFFEASERLLQRSRH